MNLRVTIGFLAVALVLGVLVVGLDKFNIGPTAAAQANATATTTAAQQPQIFMFDDSKVTAFELHQADKSASVTKQGTNWVIAGSSDPANTSSFTSLIVNMSTLKSTREVDNPGTDLSQYGLDKVNESAIATLDDGTKYEIDLGGKTPVQTGVYAKRADTATVYVIAATFQSDLERLVANPNEPPTPTPAPPTFTPAPTPVGTPGVAPAGTPTPTA